MKPIPLPGHDSGPDISGYWRCNYVLVWVARLLECVRDPAFTDKLLGEVAGSRPKFCKGWA